MYDQIIKNSVIFGPTVIFALIVLIRILIGYHSGARRQVIFIIHSIIAFAVCLIIYFALVNNRFFDKFILDVVNKFLGKDGLEEMLGVNPNCKTMREVLVQYIPSQMNFFDGLQLILKDNGAYLLTLVNISYHIILAFVLYFVYLLLEGIMFIFYLIFYSERKHRNKKNARYEDGLEEQPYIKHKKYGAIIGLFRGLAKGLICLSFMGSLFFVISGTGNKNRAKYETKNDTYNLGFTIYKEIGNYGEYGIFKVLNMCKDRDDVPYYLYAADLVFQGGLKDEARGINENIYLREELNAYVEFSTDTFDLLMKYGSDELIPIILGEYDGNAMDVIIKIMQNEDFQAEFKVLINNFDAKTYIINFALSLVDSISNHLEEVSFTQGLNADAIDVMNIAFKKGYLSETIPFEKNLKASKKDDVELGYIKPSSVLTAKDARILLNSIFEIINISEKYKDDSNLALKLVEGLTKYVSKLSIIDEARSDELNPVLKRLYAFVDSKYLSESAYKNDGGSEEMLKKQRRMEQIIYKNEYYNDIDWVKELNILVNSVEDVLLIYDDVFVGNRDAFSATLAIFDETNGNYDRNIKMYHELVEKLSDSKVLGEAASSIIVTTNIEKFISENIIEGFTVPSNISYANNNNGENKEYGELYYFLKGLERINEKVEVDGKEEKTTLLDLISNSTTLDEKEAFDLILNISTILARNEDGGIYAENILRSKMLHSLFSSYLIKNSGANEGFSIYIDKSVVKNNLINYDELVGFFKMAPDVLKLARPIIEEKTDDTKAIIDLFEDPIAKEALKNVIFEGTFSSVMYNNLSSNENLVFPEYFANKDSWVSTKKEKSEIVKLINALNNPNFDLYAFIGSDDDEDKGDPKETIKKLTKEDVDEILDSGILYYSLSKYLVNNGTTLIDKLSIIVPNVVRISDPTRDAFRIERNTLSVFLCNAKHFIPEEGEEIVAIKLMKKLLDKDIMDSDEVLDNNIYSATFSYSICTPGSLLNEMTESLPVPEKTATYASEEKLIETFTSANPWKREAKNLIYGIDDLIDIKSQSDDYNFDNIEALVKDDISILNNPSTHYNDLPKLDAIYKSYMLGYKLTKILHSTFETSVSQRTLELDLNRWDIYSIENIRGVVFAVDYYAIDIHNPVTEDEGKNIVKKEYVKRINNESNFNSVYKSMLIRDLVAQGMDELLVIKETEQGKTPGLIVESDRFLLTDNNDFYYQGEVDSIMDLLKAVDVIESDFDNTEALIEKVNSSIADSNIIDIDELDNLYNHNATGIIFTNHLEKLEVPYEYYKNYLELVKGARRKISYAGAKKILGLDE